jgi:hypothetical protein
MHKDTLDMPKDSIMELNVHQNINILVHVQIVSAQIVSGTNCIGTNCIGTVGLLQAFLIEKDPHSRTETGERDTVLSA